MLMLPSEDVEARRLSLSGLGLPGEAAAAAWEPEAWREGSAAKHTGRGGEGAAKSAHRGACLKRLLLLLLLDAASSSDATKPTLAFQPW